MRVSKTWKIAPLMSLAKLGHTCSLNMNVWQLHKMFNDTIHSLNSLQISHIFYSKMFNDQCMHVNLENAKV